MPPQGRGVHSSPLGSSADSRHSALRHQDRPLMSRILARKALAVIRLKSERVAGSILRLSDRTR